MMTSAASFSLLPRLIGLAAITSLLMLPGISVAGGDGSAALTNAELVAALKGDGLTYRSRVLDADAGARFAEGIVFGIAEQLDVSGQWCGMSRIAPNELVNLVFDKLSSAPEPEDPAIPSLEALLIETFPCE